MCKSFKNLFCSSGICGLTLRTCIFIYGHSPVKISYPVWIQQRKEKLYWLRRVGGERGVNKITLMNSLGSLDSYHH